MNGTSTAYFYGILKFSFSARTLGRISCLYRCVSMDSPT